MEAEHQITFGPFRLEVTQGRLWRDDQMIPLRPRSLAMLGYLAAPPGRQAREPLSPAAWDATTSTNAGPASRSTT